MKKTRRLLSLLLAVPMLTCCIPLSAWAAEETADPSQSNAPYAWPLPSSGAITQGYSSDEHQALDIAIEEGTPVLAAESGTVVHTQVWTASPWTATRATAIWSCFPTRTGTQPCMRI